VYLDEIMLMPASLGQNITILSDNEVVQRVLGGETDLYQLIIRRYNRRLYRVAWAIVHDEHEAEDVIQETYVRAYEHLAQFAGRSLFSTWLTRIAVHEAWRRAKRLGRECDIEETSVSALKARRVSHTPEDDLLAIEARTVLEQAIDALPTPQRSVFVMHFLEEMSTTEIAECLGISEQAVKMRFSRARLTLRRTLYDRAGATDSMAFQFLGERCDRVTAAVLSRLPVFTFRGTEGEAQ
jgi:RNA polymerase sigma-70 factor (ECF subfamily)